MMALCRWDLWELSCLARTPSHPPKSQGDREGTSGGGPRTRGLKHQLPTASQAAPGRGVRAYRQEGGGSREQDSTGRAPAGLPGESKARLTRKETGPPRISTCGVFGHCTGTPLQSCFLHLRQNWVALNQNSQFHWPVQTWVETGSWRDEESVRMAYGSQLHAEKSRTMEGKRKEGLGLERCST